MRARAIAWSVLSKRSSTGMTLSLVALFMALSGTTYAVTQLPARSVGSAELQRGAVRSENIANGAVASSKLSQGSSARQARQSSAKRFRANVSYAAKAGYADYALHADTAPLADRATFATTAGSASVAGSATTAGAAGDTAKLGGLDSSRYLSRSTIVEIPRFSLGNEETKVMLEYGPFKLTARCYINDALGEDDADVLISTTQPHSAFEGFSIDPDLSPGDFESTRSVIGVGGPTGAQQFESSADGTAVAPDGTEIRSMIFYSGLNLDGQAGPCTFGGMAIL
jgi:hypothetical protein